MENLLEAIRGAVAPGATEEMRVAGIAACRSIPPKSAASRC